MASFYASHCRYFAEYNLSLKATLFYYPVGPQKTFEIFGSKIGLRKEMVNSDSEISIFVLYLSIYLNIFSFWEEE